MKIYTDKIYNGHCKIYALYNVLNNVQWHIPCLGFQYKQHYIVKYTRDRIRIYQQLFKDYTVHFTHKLNGYTEEYVDIVLTLPCCVLADLKI